MESADVPTYAAIGSFTDPRPASRSLPRSGTATMATDRRIRRLRNLSRPDRRADHHQVRLIPGKTVAWGNHSPGPLHGERTRKCSKPATLLIETEDGKVRALCGEKGRHLRHGPRRDTQGQRLRQFREGLAYHGLRHRFWCPEATPLASDRSRSRGRSGAHQGEEVNTMARRSSVEWRAVGASLETLAQMPAPRLSRPPKALAYANSGVLQQAGVVLESRYIVAGRWTRPDQKRLRQLHRAPWRHAWPGGPVLEGRTRITVPQRGRAVCPQAAGRAPVHPWQVRGPLWWASGRRPGPPRGRTDELPWRRDCRRHDRPTGQARRGDGGHRSAR